MKNMVWILIPIGVAAAVGAGIGKGTDATGQSLTAEDKDAPGAPAASPDEARQQDFPRPRVVEQSGKRPPLTVEELPQEARPPFTKRAPPQREEDAAPSASRAGSAPTRGEPQVTPAGLADRYRRYSQEARKLETDANLSPTEKEARRAALKTVIVDGQE